MRDAERLRVQRHFYPRPPEEVIDTCILWGFRKPEEQDWILGIGLHDERPREFRCGFHRPTLRDLCNFFLPLPGTLPMPVPMPLVPFLPLVPLAFLPGLAL
jgi:hypothetical protein